MEEKGWHHEEGLICANEHPELVCFGTFNEVSRADVVQPLQWMDVSTPAGCQSTLQMSDSN